MVEMLLAGGAKVARSDFRKRTPFHYAAMGENSKLMEYMNRCKGVLFLSKMYEGMPMTILEAFAHKKPVLARHRGAMVEMIRPGENGGLYHNVEELCELIDTYSAIADCKRLGATAYTDFQEHYSEAVAYGALIDVYQTVMVR